MPSEFYELQIEDRKGYLYACVTAPKMSLQIAVDYSNELMSHLRQTSHNKVLFVRETPALESQSHFAIVGSLLANMLPQHIALAVVDRSTHHRLVREQILKERANKGRNINAFDTFEEAEAWLLNSQAADGPPSEPQTSSSRNSGNF